MIFTIHHTHEDLWFLDYIEEDYISEHEVNLIDLVIQENCDCGYYIQHGGCAE